MKRMWSKDTNEILSVGKTLSNFGVHNWALTKVQALIAVEQLTSLGIPILGGDVYEERDGYFQSNYDSWHCDILSNENEIDYLNRSSKQAKEYIDNYKSKELDKIFFVIVPSD
jgi:Immunity protein 40